MSAVISIARPVLRTMRVSDVASVVEVECASYEFPWSVGIFRDCLRIGYDCYVYQAAHGLVGHGIMSVAVGECHLLNICVHPEYQRQGLGRNLVNFLLRIARARRARVAMLEVRVSNVPAYKLYADMGFDEIGVRKAYYPARYSREDAIILAKELYPLHRIPDA